MLFIMLCNNSLAQTIDVKGINFYYSSAVKNWTTSSHLANPYFDSLSYIIQPIYNKYNIYDIEIPPELNFMSRNYIRFMYEYYWKFNILNGLENGWRLSQSLKNYSTLKYYNNYELARETDSPINKRIRKTTNIFNFEDWDSLNKDLSKYSENTNIFISPPTIKELQQKLNYNEVYLSFSFSLNERSFYILKITKNSQKVIKSDITSFEFINRIALLKGLFEKDDDLIIPALTNLNTFSKDKNISLNLELNIQPNLQILQKEILEKIKIDKDDKIIIDNDIFTYLIPFDLLKNPLTNRYLIEDNQISYVPNAEYFMKLRNVIKPTSYKTVLAFSSSGHESNVGFDNEIDLIKDFFSEPNRSIFKNIDKNEVLNTFKKPSKYDVIHISTHFKREVDNSIVVDQLKDNYELEGFNFSPIIHPKGKYYFELGNTKLYPSDIITKNNSSTNLLVLSGCESATGDDLLNVIKPIAIGYKLEGNNKNIDNLNSPPKLTLTTKMLMNGGCYCNSTESFTNLSLISLPFKSKYTIAFQNKISIESSEQFFRQFYEYLSKYNDVHIAFRKTKLEFLNRIESNNYEHFSIILISD